MTYIGATPTTGDFLKLDSISTSATATFNLRQGGVAVYPQSANHCIVSLNGVVQAPQDAFTIVNDTIVFSSSLARSDVINFILVLGNVNDIGTVSDDTISAAKIQTDAVTQAKIADEAIDEARMQISNAGSNGQFLSKQSGNTGGLTWAAAGGKIAQIIYNSSIPTSAKTTTSTSFVDTGLECTITPTSASNKILLVAGFGDRSTSGHELATTFYVDDTTNLGNSSYGWSFDQGGGSGYNSALTMVQVHAPSSTSSIDYSVYFKVSNSSSTATAWQAYTGVTMLAIEFDGTSE